MSPVANLWKLACLLFFQIVASSPVARGSDMATSHHYSYPRITLVNNLGNDTTTTITCLDTARNVSVFVGQDGLFHDFKDGYDFSGYTDANEEEWHPFTPQRIPSEDISIPLGSMGGNFSFQLPTFVSACRAYYAKGELWMGAVPGADGRIGAVEPAFTNPGDNNYNMSWAFAEFAWVKNETFVVNPSSVDFVDIGVALNLTRMDSNETLSIEGLFPDAKHHMCEQLKKVSTPDAPWSDGCHYDGQGNLTRVVAPTHIAQEGAFEAYWNPYIDQVLAHYAENPLVVRIGGGERQCRTDFESETLSCDGIAPIHFRPTPKDIFGCNSGPFARRGAVEEEKAIMTNICARMNRGTMIDSDNRTADPLSSKMKAYESSVHNEYSEAVHNNERDGLGYGFPYDDVDEDGKAVAGVLSVPWDQTGELTIFVGGRPSHRDHNNVTASDISPESE
ncbi:Putative beta-1,3-glucanase, Osmotin/thaumatin-like superfamily, glucan endo-1,3-beta-glucosidase [Septoria linicola]|uniref:Beta-1,3-glucanase, Osmotin/thaumatin-like superfamily, glucan endo-1,3-beta-glucosidase n=1 Tax=Septoria linicola TaxID=215465 RepID=A0A9Q9EL42_9PEZI|nr:Putative beta-1,3-glucanase, Osmotin/thaumatin-like superfamily, glucan endo-1,3-beta-glucosidase [Septoria linicola]